LIIILQVTHYTTSVLLRIKLGGALQKCDVVPHIYESGEEASRALKLIAFYRP